MVLITKEECFKLNNMGYVFGDDLHKSYSKHPKYYLTETKKALDALNSIRNGKMVYKYN